MANPLLDDEQRLAALSLPNNMMGIQNPNVPIRGPEVPTGIAAPNPDVPSFAEAEAAKYMAPARSQFAEPPRPAGWPNQMAKETPKAPVADEFVRPQAPAEATPRSPQAILNQPNPFDLSKEQKSYLETFEPQKLAIREQGRLAVEKGRTEAAILDQLQQDTEMFSAQRQQRLIDRQKEMAEKQREIADTAKEVANMSPDSNRFWANKTTGQKLLGMLAVFLGGAGGGGRENSVLQMFDRAIQRDIDDQKMQIAQAKTGVAGKENAYKMMLDRFGNEDIADAATKSAALEKVKLQLDSLMARTSSQEAQAKSKLLLGQIDQMQKGLGLQIAEAQMREKAMGQAQAAISQGLATGNINTESLPPEIRERTVPGFAGTARSKEGATKLRELNATVDDAQSGIDQLMSMTNNPEFRLSPEKRAEAKTIAATLKGALRTPLVGPGAVSESEWKLLDSIIANPTDLTNYTPSTIASLNALSSRLQSKLANTAKSEGLGPSLNKVQRAKARVASFQPTRAPAQEPAQTTGGEGGSPYAAAYDVAKEKVKGFFE